MAQTNYKAYASMTFEQFKNATDIELLKSGRWEITSKIDFTKSFWKDGERTDTLHKYPVTLGFAFDEPGPEAALRALHEKIIHNENLQSKKEK